MIIQDIIVEHREYRNVPGIFPDGAIGFTFHYDDERSVERNIPVDKIVNMCRSAYKKYPRDIVYLHDESFIIQDSEHFRVAVVKTEISPNKYKYIIPTARYDLRIGPKQKVFTV